jgi:hypothetical protein
LAPHFEKQPNQSSDSGIENRHSHVSPLLMCLGSLLGWFVKSDNCKKDTIELQTANDEDVLFCTLCNVEVECLLLLKDQIAKARNYCLHRFLSSSFLWHAGT